MAIRKKVEQAEQIDAKWLLSMTPEAAKELLFMYAVHMLEQRVYLPHLNPDSKKELLAACAANVQTFLDKEIGENRGDA